MGIERNSGDVLRDDQNESGITVVIVGKVPPFVSDSYKSEVGVLVVFMFAPFYDVANFRTVESSEDEGSPLIN